jgi:cytochrome P450
MSCLVASISGSETSCRQVLPFRVLSCSSGFYLSLACTALAVSCVYLYLIWKRRQTRRKLEQSGLPTIFWRPKFVNYLPDENDLTLEKKLASSTITNILPRMQRLKGPYDMYGTVYGLSTAVIHIAHPVPAAAILTAARSQDSSSSSSAPAAGPGRPRRSVKFNSSGATKSPAYNHFKNFCGDGVFTADGEDWREKRAAVMHALLRGSGGQGFEQKVERETQHAANMIIQEIESRREGPGTKVQTNIEIVPLLQRATIGLIYRYITNSAIDTFGDGLPSAATKIAGTATTEDDDDDDTSSTDQSLSSIDSTPSLQEKSQPRPSLLSSYLLSITRIRMIILAQSRSIWFLLPRWWYRTFASMYREEEHTMGPIRDFARVACENAEPGSPLGILRKNPVYQAEGSKGTGVSKNLLDEAITLLFAGQDTSAATLSWTLHLLSLYPAIQDKLAKEVQTVLGGSSTDTEPFVTKKVISSLPYLDAVVKESMRLYPVAPFVVRNLPFPVSIKQDEAMDRPSTVLPAGSIACIWIYGLHHNPQFWNRPDDFVPERWLDPELRDEGITCGAYMPFAVGPRNCVGQPLANIILRGMLARLIHRYEFRCDDLTPGTDPASLRKDMQVGFTVLPKGGVTLAVHQRTPC